MTPLKKKLWDGDLQNSPFHISLFTQTKKNVNKFSLSWNATLCNHCTAIRHSITIICGLKANHTPFNICCIYITEAKLQVISTYWKCPDPHPLPQKKKLSISDSKPPPKEISSLKRSIRGPFDKPVTQLLRIRAANDCPEKITYIKLEISSLKTLLFD